MGQSCNSLSTKLSTVHWCSRSNVCIPEQNGAENDEDTHISMDQLNDVAEVSDVLKDETEITWGGGGCNRHTPFLNQS